ncbi:hypothetical protein BDZ94DRAFT_1299379 [Collybia nuda]|uniref:RNase H type-1 domain-containing protein n=1 Tax=Collybia nuda TaxID=64659 RepID=A0A9P5Y4M2_9AGAR|nr:hypothetical protein BDZ94DRAFT_1299379 [Collybia nuda]
MSSIICWGLPFTLTLWFDGLGIWSVWGDGGISHNTLVVQLCLFFSSSIHSTSFPSPPTNFDRATIPNDIKNYQAIHPAEPCQKTTNHPAQADRAGSLWPATMMAKFWKTTRIGRIGRREESQNPASIMTLTLLIGIDGWFTCIAQGHTCSILQTSNIELDEIHSIHIFSDSTNVIYHMMDASHHSGQMASLAICDMLLQWLDSQPNNHLHLHHITTGVELEDHQLVHIFISSAHVEVGAAPLISADYTRCAAVIHMLEEWNNLFYSLAYIGHAPIGAYQSRFFPNEPTTSALCLDGQIPEGDASAFAFNVP